MRIQAHQRRTQSRISHLLRVITSKYYYAPFLLVILAGCSDNSIVNDIEDYRARLTRVTQQSAPATQHESPQTRLTPTFPNRRQRLLPEQDHRVSLFKVLNITYCNLPQLMAQRNDPMGKVMQPPVAMIYEFQLREELTKCLAKSTAQNTEKSAEHTAFLQSILAEKSARTREILWNLIIGSIENAQHVQAKTRLLEAEDSARIKKITESIDVLRHYSQKMIAQKFSLDRQAQHAIYDAYQTLEQGRILGALVQTLRTWTDEISMASAILEATDRARFCPQGKPIQRVKFLQNVVIRYFGQGIQYKIAPLDQSGEKLLISMDQLFKLFEPAKHGAQKAVFQYWSQTFRAPDSTWRTYRSTIKTHAKTASDLLASCGFGPR